LFLATADDGARRAQRPWPVERGLYAACPQRESGSATGAALRVAHTVVIPTNDDIRGGKTVSVETRRQARFRSVVMDEERLRTAARYVALNPAPAGLAARA